MVRVESKTSPFTFNLGVERRRRLFEKSLKESARRKKRVAIGEILREIIDKALVH